jgi:methionyl-tRNA formyltransferase
VLRFVPDFNERAGTIGSHAIISDRRCEVPLNIVLLGHYDLPSLYALQRVIEAAPQHRYSAFFSGDLPAGRDTPGALRELADVDARLCERLRQSGRLGKPLLDAGTLPRPNSAHGLEALESLAPDLVISIRYRRILHDEAIAIPRLGVLNLHSGVLPDYKGVMATFWAMLHGEPTIGATLHRIVDSGIDTGPVIGLCRIRAAYGSSYLANVLRLYGPGCELIAAALQLLAAGREPAAAPQEPGGRYFSTPRGSDIVAFTKRGLVLANGLEMAEVEPRKT